MTFRRRLATRVRASHRRWFWSRHDREEHTCDGCGRGYEETGFRWEVHHRDGDWLNGHPTNLVGICHRCHVAVHHSENVATDIDGWENRFEDLDEGLSGSVWRGMTVSRKTAHNPDCAFASCQHEATTTVAHHQFGERYVCGAHVIAAASGAESVPSTNSEVDA